MILYRQELSTAFNKEVEDISDAHRDKVKRLLFTYFEDLFVIDPEKALLFLLNIK